MTKDGALYILNLTETDLHRKVKGFYWDSLRRAYVTPSHVAAGRLEEFADFKARRALYKVLLKSRNDADRLASYVPPEGYALKKIQRRAIELVLGINRFYVALDQGLGKAVVASVVSAIVGAPIVLITPPTLIENIRNELSRWAHTLRVRTHDEAFEDFLSEVDVLIVSDSVLNQPRIPRLIEEFVKSWAENEPTLIIDEAHRFKNADAGRSKILYGFHALKRKGMPVGEKTPGLMEMFERVVFMSGSPADRGLLDLYAPLSNAAPETIQFMDRMSYARYYCGAYKNDFGKWTLEGTPAKGRAKELGMRVIVPDGKFMLRVKKADSGIELPPRIEEMFVISGKMGGQLKAIDESLGKKYDSDEDVTKLLIAHREGKKEAGEIHGMEYRKLLGLEKVKHVADYVNYILDETAENVLVFANHTEVIHRLTVALSVWKPFVITGKTPMSQRQPMVDKFQAGKGRVFIGNIRAMGVGLTLTKADRVVFAEYEWNPGVNDQAADRAHRIGRNETVLIQYMVYPDSLDKRIIETLMKKRSIISSFEVKG
jgi:SWI/SNF-related matrix-associated actin-dependent regulator 1 of chromatin subfamily A